MLLERDDELGLMADVLVDVRTSGGKVVLVRGEAGIGKSSLVTDFIQAHADDAHVLYGSCDDLLTPSHSDRSGTSLAKRLRSPNRWGTEIAEP